MHTKPHPGDGATRRPAMHQENALPASPRPDPTDRLLTVAEVAERLGTTERFPRRLIAERRITFVKLGTGRRAPVRIRESAVAAFIAAATVEAAG